MFFLKSIITKIKLHYLKVKWDNARKEASDRYLEREKVKIFLSTPMKLTSVKKYNERIFIESAGQFNGGLNELEIKKRVWSCYKHLFKGKKFKHMVKLGVFNKK